MPLREDVSLQLRYSVYEQSISLPSTLDNCNNINPDFVNTFPTPNAVNAAAAAKGGPFYYPGFSNATNTGTQTNCLTSPSVGDIGQASLPVREELALGAYLTSMVGYGLTYNTLDNNKTPTSGLLVSFGQDFAGVGGDVSYLRTTVDLRSYYEVVSDLVSILHLQAGDMLGFTKCPTGGGCAVDERRSAHARRLQDGSQSGARLRARGAWSARHHAGHGRRSARRHDVLGRQFGGAIPVLLPAEGFRVQRRLVRRFRLVCGVTKGETQFAQTGEVNGTVTSSALGTSFYCGNCGLQYVDTPAPRVSVGASIIWASPFGPLRFDFAYPIVKEWYDRTQFFQFGGGTKF